MNPIRNQGQCGCCWAFAATNPVEFQLCQKFGFQVALRYKHKLEIQCCLANQSHVLLVANNSC